MSLNCRPNGGPIEVIQRKTSGFSQTRKSRLKKTGTLPSDVRSDHGRFIDTVKQDCFYSSFTDAGTSSSPDQRADSELAATMLTVAKLLVGERSSPMTSEAELQLWVKHQNPVWKSPMDEMKRALAACYAEAEARGILQGSGTAAGMLDFLFEDVTVLPS